MKLYPKKLRTIDDLEREKKILLKEKRKLDKEDIFSLKGIVGGSGDDDDEEGGAGFDIASLLAMLPIKNPLVSMGVQMAGRIFTRKKKNRDKEKDERSGSKKKSNPLRTIALDVATGYLKWKAIELTWKAGRNYINKRRQHNRERAAAGLEDD